MKNRILIILGLFLTVILLGFLTNWHFREMIKNLKESSSELKKISAPQIESEEKLLKGLPFFSSENNYQEFTSSDQKLKIKYPASWLVGPRTEYLQELIPPDWKEAHDLKIIFSAQYLGVKGFAQIIVYQGKFNFSVQEIFEKMHQTNRQQGWQVEILDSQIEKDEGIFEAIYTSETNKFHSREKILKTDKENTFIISFVAPEQYWQNFTQEVDLVLIEP